MPKQHNAQPTKNEHSSDLFHLWITFLRIDELSTGCGFSQTIENKAEKTRKKKLSTGKHEADPLPLSTNPTID